MLIEQRSVVSTHSRPKAAGLTRATYGERFKAFQHTAARRRLGRTIKATSRHLRFNTQPPEGGWAREQEPFVIHVSVSTHSRPKAAGN